MTRSNGRGATFPDGVVDVHTHAIAPDLRAPADPAGYPWPSVRPVGGDPGLADILVGERWYRRIDDRCWSARRRLDDMDAEGVAIQVLSPIPVTLCHDAPPAPAAAYARAQNTFFAELVAHAPDRFRALAAVPLQDPEVAAAELRHAMRELGLVGAEIGTRVGDRELADPFFDPFFDAADELGATVLVHPVDETLDPRLAAAGLAFGVGMPAETAVAGAALLTAGTLAARPNVRVCLAHGGGALPGLLGRITRGQHLAAAAASTGPVPEADTATVRAGSLWCDSLTYEATSLLLALERFGADHVVLGTDYPFAAREAPAGAVLDDLPTAGDPLDHVGSDLRARIRRTNAAALLSLIPELEPETR